MVSLIVHLVLGITVIAWNVRANPQIFSRASWGRLFSTMDVHRARLHQPGGSTGMRRRRCQAASRESDGSASLTILPTTLANCLGSDPALYGMP